MSKISFANFYESIINSKDNENYFAELSTTLIFVDICSQIEYPNEKSNNKRYKNWLKEYYLPTLPEEIRNHYLDETNIWFLRNSILHQGSSDPNTNKNYKKWGKEKVNDIIPALFPPNIEKKIFAADTNRHDKYPDLFFDIHYFCNSIIKSALTWESANRKKVEENSYLFFSIGVVAIDKNDKDKMFVFRQR